MVSDDSMPDFTALIIPTFFAGVLTFIAPCILPLVPAYLGFLSGVSGEQTRDSQNPVLAARAKRKVFLTGVFFIVGMTLVFVIFGTLAGLAGHIFAKWRFILAKASGVAIILFGLFMLGAFKKIPFLGSFLSQERRFRIPFVAKNDGPKRAALFGAAFAFGWTPCVGPVLGSVLLLVSATSTALQGALLLFIFSLGLSVPFLTLAAAAEGATKYVKRISPFLQWGEIIGGLLLLLIGSLLLTNKMALFVAWAYKLLRFINYESLLQYL